MRGTRVGFVVGSVLLAALLVGASGVGSVGASHRFPDVPDGHVFHDEIAWLADNDVTEGYSDGTFRPAGTVTRQEMAAFLYRLWTVVVSDPPPAAPGVSFSDVPAGHPFEVEIEWLAGWEIARGYPDGTYRPGGLVTRQEMAAFLERFWSLAAGDPPTGAYPDPGFSDVADTHLFYDEIAWMAGVGIAGGFTDGTFRPGSSVDRGSMAAFMFRLAERMSPAEYVVNTEADGVDAIVGDGVCDVTVGADDCSLRAAISETNATVAADTIEILAGIDPMLSIAGIDEDDNAKGDLDVHHELVVEGNGATIDGAGVDRVFQGLEGEAYFRLTLRDLTVTGGHLSGEPGGGISMDGMLTLDHVEVSGNDTGAPGFVSTAASGVYVTNLGGGESFVTDSLIAENNSPATADALFTFGARVEITDTQIMDNTSTSGEANGIGSFEGGLSLQRVVVKGHSGTAVGMADTGPGDIIDSALVGNGRGVSTDFSTLDIVNTTISNEGPAVTALIDAPKITASTLVTTGDGPTLEVQDSGGFDLKATIIAGPAASPRCELPDGEENVSRGWNLATDDSCGLDEATDLSSTDPMLGPLGDHGGPTPTHLPEVSSPAVDHIPTGTAGLCDASTPTDQRGELRPSGDGCDVGAVEVQWPAAPEVNTPLDGDDADPGDGVCEMTAGENDCSLRAAISEANANAAIDTISIADGIDPVLTVAGVGEGANATGDLDVHDTLRIEGNGATVDASELDRVLQVHISLQQDLHTLWLRDVTLTNGKSNGASGAAIYSEANLDLDGVHLVGNDSSGPTPELEAASAIGQSTYGDGGTLSIRHSTITGNTAPPGHPALRIYGAYTVVQDTVIADNVTTGGVGHGISAGEGSMALERALISGHSGTAVSWGDVAPGDVIDSAIVDNGRGLSTDYSVDVVNSTIANEGPAIQSMVGSPRVVASTLVATESSTVRILEGGTFQPKGSIIAGPSGIERCDMVTVDGLIDSKGWNIGTDDSCGLDEASDRPSTDPMLGPLGDNGGPTPTMVPGATSPAVDHIPAGTAGLCDGSTPSDQRGEPRPSGVGCDVGAVEVQVELLVVNTALDGDDADPGDGVCEMTAGERDCSLRAAISEANAVDGVDEIVILEGVDPVLSIAGQDEDANATGDLDVYDGLVVDGNGATVDGNGIDRVIEGHDTQESYITLEMRELTITGGLLPGGTAAGIRMTGNLVLDEVEVRDNDIGAANFNAEVGSGVYVEAFGGTFDMYDSLVTENNGPPGGDAVHNYGAQVTIRDTAIVDNTSTTGSSADGVGGFEGGMTLERVTVSGHSGAAMGVGDTAPADIIDSALVDNGSGVRGDYSTIRIVNSTIASEGTAVAVLVGSPQVESSTLLTSGDHPTVGIYEYGTFRPKGSIIAGPAGTPQCELVPLDGLIDSQGWNIGTDDSCGLDEASDLPSTDPLLGPLGDHGGPTLTLMIDALSAAIDAIPTGTVGLCDGSRPADQRGQPRPAGAACDIGAVERQPTD